MGLFGKKKTTDTKRSTTTTMTPTNPQWVTDSVQGLNTKIDTTFNGLDPTKIVAGPNPLQTQAGVSAGNLTTPSQFGEGSNMIRAGGMGSPSRVSAASSLDGLDKFMNPFLKDVVDTSLADYDFGAGMTREQDKLAKANDITFGGSGGSIQTALSNDAITRGRGTLSAGLRSDGFNTALAASADDANRRQQADVTNGQFSENALTRQINAGNSIAAIGGMEADNTRANISTQNVIGSTLRDIQNDQNRAPIDLLKEEAEVRNSLPLDLFKGMTQDEQMNQIEKMKTSGISMGTILKYAAAAGLALTGNPAAGLAVATSSDRRLKRDIVKLYDREDGIGVYLYRYIWSPLRYIGVMAQEVLKVKPEAVVTMPDGYYAVYYGKL